MSRKCIKCSREKLSSNFLKGGDICKKCRTRDKRPDERRRRKARSRALLEFIRAISPCADCGQIYPYYIMQFDHLGVESKDYNVTKMKMFSDTRIMQEISKCDVVCANCHAARTWKREHEIQLN